MVDKVFYQDDPTFISLCNQVDSDIESLNIEIDNLDHILKLNNTDTEAQASGTIENTAKKAGEAFVTAIKAIGKLIGKILSGIGSIFKWLWGLVFNTNKKLEKDLNEVNLVSKAIDNGDETVTINKVDYKINHNDSKTTDDLKKIKTMMNAQPALGLLPNNGAMLVNAYTIVEDSVSNLKNIVSITGLVNSEIKSALDNMELTVSHLVDKMKITQSSGTKALVKESTFDKNKTIVFSVDKNNIKYGEFKLKGDSLEYPIFTFETVPLDKIYSEHVKLPIMDAKAYGKALESIMVLNKELKSVEKSSTKVEKDLKAIAKEFEGLSPTDKFFTSKEANSILTVVRKMVPNFMNALKDSATHSGKSTAGYVNMLSVITPYNLQKI